MSLRSVNLNLLPILRALLNERGVSRAARALSLSPASTSEALAQLRRVLDDPLLVRTGAQMALTPRALELREHVDRLCDEIEGLLTKRLFDPAVASRTFVIATTDHYVYLFGQEIIRRVAASAPRVAVQFDPWTADAAERMAAREVDVGLMPRFTIDDLSPAPVRLKTLFPDRLVLIFAAEHPLASRPALTHADLLPYRHVLFTMDQVDGKRQRSAEFRGSDSIARVWPVLLAPLMLPGTDHLSLVPHSLAVRLMAELALQWRELPSSATQVNGCMAWSTLMDADAGHQWFRQLVEEAVQARTGDLHAVGPP